MLLASHHLVAPRTARFVTAGEIDGLLEDVWFACHGYGQLASEFLGSLRALEHPKRLLVAPEALSRFYHPDHEKIGACWMTREDRLVEMDDYVRYLDLVHDRVFQLTPRDAVRLRLLGFSQGAATAARWAVRGKPTIDHLILWGSPLPPELDDESSLAPLRGMRVSLVRGTRDDVSNARAWSDQRARLRKHGVSFEELDFDGGHRLDDDTLRALTHFEKVEDNLHGGIPGPSSEG